MRYKNFVSIKKGRGGKFGKAREIELIGAGPDQAFYRQFTLIGITSFATRS